jgi:hypothetical protein
MGRKPDDLKGQEFCRLTVTERFSNTYDRHGVEWMCMCKCGNKVIAYGHHLKQGKVKSCGCLKSEVSAKNVTDFNIKHGMYGSPEYISWLAMKARCYNKKHEWYHRYGGRGIGVCDRWKNSFQDFFEDMGAKPSPEYTIERRDNNIGYQPGNCYWATQQEQMSNTSRNVYYLYNGRRVTQSQLARTLNVTVDALRGQLTRSPTLDGVVTPL